MRVVAQLSDLHFGAVDSRLLEPLRRRVRQVAPDLVAISGDLTQRAREQQFREARLFLDTLPRPQIVVPGNHDVPLYDLFRRFFSPFADFRRQICEDLEPHYVDEELAVVGVNTARSLVLNGGGRINAEQVENVRSRLCLLPVETVKIVVSHHPFDLPLDWDERHQLAGRAAMALRTLATCGASVYVSGHMHRTHAAESSFPFDIGGFRALMVGAGTATSTRRRGEANSFNVLRISPGQIVVDSFEWDETAAAFDPARSSRFRRTPRGWAAVA
jgi:3',5'-cyclic AMP phosphodiesterase CpdA